jgi:hypothetical protein
MRRTEGKIARARVCAFAEPQRGLPRFFALPSEGAAMPIDTRTGSSLDRLLALTRIDLPRGSAQPSAWRFAVAVLVAIAGSLAACWVLATVAVLLVPSLAGYGHLRFPDYAKLTVIGVVIACLAWPVVAWFSSQGRRLLLVLAVLVTVGSLAPDVWILLQGQPFAGVLTLAVMHVALLAVTYPALVLIAPQRRRP